MNTETSLTERVNDTPAARKVCRFPDCGRPLRSLGLCNAHYQQQWSGRELQPLWADLPERICSFPDCGRLHFGRGLCIGHYKQQYDGKVLVPLRSDVSKGGCGFPDCDRPYSGLGLCAGHWKQRRKGKALTPLRETVRGLTAEERFREKTDTSGACHIFTGTVHPNTGYGSLAVDRKGFSAHRFAWKLAYGKIPSRLLHLDHLCHVKLCVNVHHLRLADGVLNAANTKGRPDYSLTDVEGVFWLGRADGRFRAVLSGDGVSAIVGHYPTFEDAALALEEAKAGWQLPLPGMERLTAAYDGRGAML